jgi:hypothetical protein
MAAVIQSTVKSFFMRRRKMPAAQWQGPEKRGAG